MSLITSNNNLSIMPPDLVKHIKSWMWYPGSSIEEKLTEEDKEYIRNHMETNKDTITRIEHLSHTYRTDITPPDAGYGVKKYKYLKEGDQFQFNREFTAFSHDWRGTINLLADKGGPGGECVVFRVHGHPPHFNPETVGVAGYGFSEDQKEYEVWMDTENTNFVVDKITENINIQTNPDYLPSYVTLIDVHIK